MNEFPWDDKLNSNSNPNWQLATFIITFLIMMSKFIPNKFINVDPKYPPWITHYLKNMIKRQNRLFKNNKRQWYLNDDRIRVDKFCEDGN